MLVNTFLTGLLALASTPLQVSARAVSGYEPALAKPRALVARADWPKLKPDDINPEIGLYKVAALDVTGEEGKKVIKDKTVFVKVKGSSDELDVYKDIYDTGNQGITLEILAEIVDPVLGLKTIGFVQRYVDAPDAKKEDLEGCKTALAGLHNAGWLHTDANRGNFKYVDGSWRIFDLEDARKVDDEHAFENIPQFDDDDYENPDERKELDFTIMKTKFEN